MESLNVSIRCGLSPRACQIRATVDRLTPAWRAIDRVLQCVSPFGLACSVSCTICSTCAGVIEGLGPRPLRTWPSLATPSSANRVRHARTVVGDTPTAAAMCSLACPSAAINNALARSTCRCGAVCDRDNFSNIDR